VSTAQRQAIDAAATKALRPAPSPARPEQVTGHGAGRDHVRHGRLPQTALPTGRRDVRNGATVEASGKRKPHGVRHCGGVVVEALQREFRLHPAG
jgi:hypothetical protein